jgi:hypothetical protein
MTGMLWQIVGILIVVGLVATLVVRPYGVVPVVLAFAVVIVAIVVSWNDVAQVRQQRAAAAAFQQENASASTVTVPPPNPGRSGS